MQVPVAEVGGSREGLGFRVWGVQVFRASGSWLLRVQDAQA